MLAAGLTIWLAAMLLMLVVFVLQRRLKNDGIVDVAWAYSLGLSALLLAALGPGDISRRVFLGIAAGLWSLRLGTYLLRDRVLSGKEDGRYIMLREGWGDNAARNLFLFDQAQAFFVALFALAYLPVAYAVPEVQLWQVIAAGLLAAVSLVGETLADRQLAAWRRNPANQGKTCRLGLWRYSRHPNYFFEWLHWWIYPLLAWGGAFWWVSFLGPVIMFIFLYRITGIPFTEMQALRSRGEDYARYQATTSGFIPWPPKEEPDA